MEIPQTDGEDWLIKGENQSGKTLTFNAIRYAILGDTISLQTGHGNSVESELTNGTKIHRKESGLSVKTESEGEFGPETGEEVISGAIGKRNLVGLSFIHSHFDQLPLEKLNRPKRIEVILKSTDKGLAEEIESEKKELERIESQIDEMESDRTALSSKISDRKSLITELERQKENWEEVLRLAERDDLRAISETLREHPDLEQKINDCISRRNSLQTDLQELRNEKSVAEDRDREIDELILDAMDEFICPVCDGRVGKGKSKNRLSSGCCPFCNRERDLEKVRQDLKDEQNVTEKDLDEISEEIQELEEELEGTTEKIESLKQEREELDEVNNKVIDVLHDYDHEIDEIIDIARERVANIESKLGEYGDMVISLEERKADKVAEIEELESLKRSSMEQLRELEEESAERNIENFRQKWQDYHSKLAPDLAREIKIRREGGQRGEIALIDDGGRNRLYDRRGDLSDAEIVLLNISFVCTILDKASKIGEIDWEVLVLDEPFARLDPQVKQKSLDFLVETPFQIILTSSDPEVWKEFQASETTELTRQQQSELSQFS
ncbi:hypothetical protein HZS55_20395 [Halosimplex rubrum]|uniref:Uncharacterized protein n=1 Tax=Halosimplex rubrum TaxID=869889 RepID=A0A7D5T0F5_9EURY|nr:hypothetical protein [Halosimplex rubrum]QLH79511.1 hypothetical protein HZS55_20395 [Halosimplex rubrum]